MGWDEAVGWEHLGCVWGEMPWEEVVGELTMWFGWTICL